MLLTKVTHLNASLRATGHLMMHFEAIELVVNTHLARFYVALERVDAVIDHIVFV